MVHPATDRTARLHAVISAESEAALRGVRVEASGDAKGLRARAIYTRSNGDDDVDVEYTLELAEGRTLTVRGPSRAAFPEGAEVGFAFDPDSIVPLRG